MSLQLTYDLVGTGWCRCEIRLGTSEAVVTGSYLSDCLRGLARATLDMAGGSPLSRCSFDEEPGEFRWLLRRDANELQLRILEFDELWGEQPDSEGTEIINLSCPVASFVIAVRDALRSVRSKYGLAGYLEKWVEHDFPQDELDQLELVAPRLGA